MICRQLLRMARQTATTGHRKHRLCTLTTRNYELSLHPRRWALRLGIWAFVLVLLSAVLCVSAIPSSDEPGTCYNEVDTPINQAPSVVSGFRFVRPAIIALILPKQARKAARALTSQSPKQKSAEASWSRDPHSLQNLLCTFLI